MSENRSLDEIFNARPLIERTWFRALLAAICLLALGAVVVLTPSAADADKPPRAEAVAAPATPARAPAAVNLPRQPTAEEALEWHRVHQPLYDRIVRVAGEMSAGDPEAERLATLLRERTHHARILPGGVVHSMHAVAIRSQADVDRLVNSTAIVLATRAEMGFFPSKPTASFFFSRGDLNFVDAWEYEDWYLGVLVLHELSHWDDIVVSKREPPNSRQFTDAWTDGELRAHTLENRMLDRQTNGRFSETLARVLRDERLSGPGPVGAPFRVPTEAGQGELLRAFGDTPRSSSEFGNRAGSAMVAFLMLQVGNTGPEARAAYNWMVRTGG